VKRSPPTGGVHKEAMLQSGFGLQRVTQNPIDRSIRAGSVAMVKNLAASRKPDARRFAPVTDASPDARPLSVAGISAPPRMTLGELAYGNLREAILTTKLLPGTPISENELSAAIGISRTPIREAIRRLAEERLVDVTPQYGTIVSKIDARRASQAVFVRQTIECEVLKRKGTLSSKDLAALDQEVRKHMQAIEAKDSIAAAALDDAFHARLMEFCDCPEATAATRAISGDIARILFLSGADEDYYASVAKDHARLVELMKAGKYAEAIELLRRHIGGFAVDQDRLRDHSSDFFAAD
jgi:DNA-binding GntR family transcriptional regulator